MTDTPSTGKPQPLYSRLQVGLAKRFDVIRGACQRFVYRYFYLGPWPRIGVIVVLVLLIVVALRDAYDNLHMPASAIVAIVIAILLAFLLLVDSGLYVTSLLMCSLQRRLTLLKRVDSQLSFAIGRAEQYVSTTVVEKAEIKSIANEFVSDFGNRRPFVRVAKALLVRTISNFWITVFCFAALSMSEALRLRFCGSLQLPYGHECLTVGNFLTSLLHFGYYHVVVFQSLGDASHSPTTLFTQVVAILEACVSFFYFIFIFGGFLSTSMFVQSEMTPEKLCGEFHERLKTLASANAPISSPNIG
jgi:hypothetical protein